MEYLLCSSDSNTQGVNVHTARNGVRLNWHLNLWSRYCDRCTELHSAAMGFGKISLPNEMEAIKNQYTQRTFIQPTQNYVNKGVRIYSHYRWSVSNGLSRRWFYRTWDNIVGCELLKAGATEVHVAIGSPLLPASCFLWGSIFQTRKIDCCQSHSEETRDIIGADSLTYLSIDGLIDSIGIDTDAPNGYLMKNIQHICMTTKNAMWKV